MSANMVFKFFSIMMKVRNTDFSNTEGTVSLLMECYFKLRKVKDEVFINTTDYELTHEIWL